MVRGLRSVAAAGLCVAMCAVGATTMAGSASAAARPSLKPLKVSISFDQAKYKPHATAHLMITLKNRGSHKLHHIGAACNRAGNPDGLNNTGSHWGRFSVHASGVTVAAHHSRTFHVSAKVPSGAARLGQVFVACDFGYRAEIDGRDRPQAHDSARVPGQFGAITGDVEYYKSGTSGPRAGLRGVRAVLVDSRCPLYKKSARTNSKGRFTIKHVPAGLHYKLYVFTPRGWKVTYQNPTNAMVVGKSTARMGIDVKHGTAHRPKVPAKCH